MSGVAGEVTLQVGALDRAAEKVVDARADLEGLGKQARDLLREVGAHWKGPGASAFSEVLNQWDQRTGTVISELEEVEGKLKTQERSYAQVDAEAASKQRSLASRLG